MRGTLGFLAVVLMIAALVVIVWGVVEVGQGKKGTWDIWPFYLVHGALSIVALALFAAANKGRVETAAESPGGGEG